MQTATTALKPDYALPEFITKRPELFSVSGGHGAFACILAKEEECCDRATD